MQNNVFVCLRGVTFSPTIEDVTLHVMIPESVALQNCDASHVRCLVDSGSVQRVYMHKYLQEVSILSLIGFVWKVSQFCLDLRRRWLQDTHSELSWCNLVEL